MLHLVWIVQQELANVARKPLSHALIVRLVVVEFNGGMLKSLFRALYGVLWSLGFERLAMQCLLRSLENTHEAVIIDIKNQPPVEPQEIKVIYVDKEAIAELGARYDNDFAPVRSVRDIN